MSCAIGHFCFNAYFNTKNKYVYYTLWRSAAWVSLDVWLCYLIYNNKPSTLCLSLSENSLHTSSISVYYIPNSKLVSILTLVQRSSCHPDDMRKWAYVTVYVCNICVCDSFVLYAFVTFHWIKNYVKRTTKISKMLITFSNKLNSKGILIILFLHPVSIRLFYPTLFHLLTLIYFISRKTW